MPSSDDTLQAAPQHAGRTSFPPALELSSERSVPKETYERRVASRAPLDVSILSPAQVEGDSSLRQSWQERVDSSTNVYRLYQSPLWWDHLRATRGDDRLRLIVVRQPDGSPLGVVPCVLRPQRIERHLAGRLVTMLSGPGVELLGGEPLVDPRQDVFDAMLGALWQTFPTTDMCRTKSVSTSGAFWRYLQSSPPTDRCFLMADGPRRPFYLIDLGQGWAAYLERFTGKQRNDLRRKGRLLAEAMQAPIDLRRIETEETVSAVYDDIDRVAGEARVRTGEPLPTLAALRDVARRGFLRSYVLYAGPRPVAFVVGYQACDTFYYADVGFSQELGRHGPGTVLLCQVVRDVCEHAPVRYFNFGIGPAEYKRRFSNVTTEDATMYVMRDTLRNRMRAFGLQSVEVARHVRTAWRDRRPRQRLPTAETIGPLCVGPVWMGLFW